MQNKTNYQKMLCRLLDMSEQDYCNTQFEKAFEYLNVQLRRDAHNISLLTSSRVFWEWWKSQWNRREKILVNDYKLDNISHVMSPSNRRFLMEKFEQIHSVENMHYYPNERMIMEITYGKMAGELIDAEMKGGDVK